jgi:hypothetical protein
MNAYQAILKAADHIQAHPALFDFERTRVPGDCGTPGCALGWIGHFAGRTQARIPLLFGLSFLHRGIAIVTTEGGADSVITVTAREFYERMDFLAVGNWRQDARVCAGAMRRYAESYHRPVGLDRAYVAFRRKLNDKLTADVGHGAPACDPSRR